MAGKNDIAWVADQIVTTLQTYMAAKVAALNAEYADGITLEDVPTDNYLISETAKPPGFPLICVIPDTTDHHPTDGEARYGIETHDLTIALGVVANEGESALKRRAIRMARAVHEILGTYRTLLGTVDDIVVQRTGYDEMLGASNMLLQQAQIQVQAITMV